MVWLVLFLVATFCAYYFFELIVEYIYYMAHRAFAQNVRYVSLETIKDMLKGTVRVHSSCYDPSWVYKPIVFRDPINFSVFFLSPKEMIKVDANTNTYLVCKSFGEYRKVVGYLYGGLF